MADGVRLREIAKHPKFPGAITFMRWLKEHQDFAANYALANETKIKRWAAQIPDIINARVPAKNGKIDWSLPPPPLGKGARAHKNAGRDAQMASG